MEEGLADRLIQAGIRTATGHQRDQVAKFGVELIEARHWRDDIQIDFKTPVYISLDIDGIDPGFAPGTGTPEVGGLTPREVVALLRGLAGAHIIGADVVEVAPQYDATSNTAQVAAQMLFTELCLIALDPKFRSRKRG